MALLFVDGCDSFTATDGSDLTTKWASRNGFVSFSPTDGRYGGGAITVSASTRYLQCNFTPAEVCFLSGSYYWNAFESAGTFMTLVDNAGNAGINLDMSTAGFISVYRLTTGTRQFVGASAIPLVKETYYRIEVKIDVKTSATGSLIVKVNEVEHINFTNFVTGGNTGSSQNNVGSMKTGPGHDFRFDDIVIHDTLGDAPTDFLGDIRIETIRPNGVGSSSEWTSSSGDGFTNVDDDGVNDGDATYVETGDLTNKDLYATGDITTSPTTIPAVVVNTMTRATGTTPRKMDVIVKSSASELFTNFDLIADASFQIKQAYFPVVPGGGSWNKTLVNAMEIGVRLTT